jgi:Skp family chaperone for outer membrane proteins
MKKIVLSSLVVLGLSTAAFAQAAAPDFATIDADASGGVSLAEAQVALPDLTEEAFTAADLDASGELSAEEFATLTATAAVPAS